MKAVKEGARSQDIAQALGMSRATLWRRYGRDLQQRG
jgi:biotin operon repressor